MAKEVCEMERKMEYEWNMARRAHAKDLQPKTNQPPAAFFQEETQKLDEAQLLLMDNETIVSPPEPGRLVTGDRALLDGEWVSIHQTHPFRRIRP